MDEYSTSPERTVTKHLGRNFEDYNPCFKEHQLTLSCLDASSYDRSKCADKVRNYQNCKTFWYQVYNDRRRKGIRPYLPIPDDRDEVKKEYLEKINKRRQNAHISQ